MSKAAGDLELLEEWRRGRVEAGNELIRRHYKGLLKKVHRRLDGNVDVANEITQQAFAVLAARRESVNVSVGGYLWKVALNNILMHRRQASRKDDLDSVTPAAEDGLLERLADRQETKIMIKALRSLPIDDQLLLKWVYADEKTQREIGETLGLRVPQVNGRVDRARERLKQEIERLEDSKSKISTLGGFDTWLASIHGREVTATHPPEHE